MSASGRGSLREMSVSKADSSLAIRTNTGDRGATRRDQTVIQQEQPTTAAYVSESCLPEADAIRESSQFRLGDHRSYAATDTRSCEKILRNGG